MDNEKLNNEEELDVVEETTQAEEISAAEETADAVEEAETVEETTDETAEPETELEDVEVTEDEIAELEALDGVSPNNSGKLAAIVGGFIAVILVVVAILWYFGIINPYERGYVDISGVTLEELANQEGYSLKEYKKTYGLPFLMPKSTNENAVRNNAKLGATVAQSGMKFEDFKEYYGWGDNITEESTVGEALGETKLSVIIGAGEMDEESAQEVLASFKEYYGLGDDITSDTLYKDVREILDRKARDQRIEEEKAAEKADDDKEDETESEPEVEEKSDKDAE